MKFSLRTFIRNLLFTQPMNTSKVPRMENLTDREISWLAFNQRVLELAEDKNIPLLERVRFLTIFSSNLDEFYMVRVASVLRKIENNITSKNLDTLFITLYDFVVDTYVISCIKRRNFFFTYQ